MKLDETFLEYKKSRCSIHSIALPKFAYMRSNTAYRF